VGILAPKDPAIELVNSRFFGISGQGAPSTTAKLGRADILVEDDQQAQL